MKKIILIVIMAMFVVATSCKKDDGLLSTKVKVNATFGGKIEVSINGTDPVDLSQYYYVEVRKNSYLDVVINSDPGYIPEVYLDGNLIDPAKYNFGSSFNEAYPFHYILVIFTRNMTKGQSGPTPFRIRY